MRSLGFAATTIIEESLYYGDHEGWYFTVRVCCADLSDIFAVPARQDGQPGMRQRTR
jgi:hypothetical protein